MNKKLTIVIPSKNEKEKVVDVIRLLGKQQLDCEIIVADSSDDQTSSTILRNYIRHSPKVIRLIEGGLPSVARNNGAKLVKTPYILFLDADVYITDATLVNDCIELAIKKDYDLITCKFKTIGGEYSWVYRLFSIPQYISSKTKPFALGGFMIFKKDTFNTLGGFDENVKIAEDYLLSKQIQPAKFKIVNRHVYTSPRRFKKKGVWSMTKLLFSSWWNRNNKEWFKTEHDYWA